MPPIIQVWKEGKIAKEVNSIAMLNDTDEYIHAIMSIGCKSGFVNKEVTEARSKLVRIKKDQFADKDLAKGDFSGVSLYMQYQENLYTFKPALLDDSAYKEMME